MYSKKVLFSDNNNLIIKQELIADAGLWTAKKRYALSLVNKDGFPTSDLEVKGLDVIRTSFPTLFRTFMTTMIKDILSGKDKELIDENILKLKESVDTTDYTLISRPTGISEISKFCDNTHQPFNFRVKGTPVHVKAAINYNDFIRYYNIYDKYALIQDTEKIKWIYLIEENPFRLDSMAYKDNDEDPPEILEYIKKYVDRKKVFDSEMEKKMQSFYTALGWGNIPTKVYQNYSIFFD
jgi:hypothetical protein